MSKQIENFEIAFNKIKGYSEILEKEGYKLGGDISFHTISYMKHINSNAEGLWEGFYVSIHSQYSGYSSVELVYSKKLEKSINSIKINIVLDLVNLLDSIKENERKCLEMGKLFNK